MSHHFLLWLSYGLFCLVVAEDVQVTIPQGELRGLQTVVDDDYSVNFFGRIPYAQPPVEDLRFAAPQGPAPSWEGERDASYHGDSCPQIHGVDLIMLIILGPGYSNYSEDCLHLNVYQPVLSSDPVATYPVMVFIHGGAFIAGTSASYDSTLLARYGQAVVVTLNYRINAIGFLSTEDANAPGNAGILDQVAALQWVRDNIQYFNGDPDNVLIFGQSAGGACVGLHLVSPQSRGLFHKVIAMSGNGLVHWAWKATYEQPANHASDLAARMDCPVAPSDELVECLRTKDAMDIASNASWVEGGSGSAFMPVEDPWSGQLSYLPENPRDMMQNGDFETDALYMAGFTQRESGRMFIGYPDPANGITREDFEDILSGWASRRFYPWPTNLQAVYNAMEFQYTPWGDPDDPIKLRDAIFQGTQDRDYVSGAYMQAMSVSELSTAYLYQFDYKSVNAPQPDHVGVPHADDLYYLFGYPVSGQAILNMTWTEEDRDMSEAFMTMWGDFARYGNPTPVDDIWESFTPDNQRVYHINGADSEMRDDISMSGVAFWAHYDEKVVTEARLDNNC